MRAVVLVGGFGTRLRPLTLDTPKAMLPVVDRPLIEVVLAGVARHGVDRAVLAMGYRPDAFVEAFPDGTCAGVQLEYAVEDAPLDTAGAIRFAAHQAGIDERFLVLNGDVVTDLDVGALWDMHADRGAEATIHLVPVEDPSRYGVVVTDERGLVDRFVEKPPPGEAPSKWINAGTYVVEPSVLERIPHDRPVSVERETFPALAAGGSLYGFQSDVYWVDAGTPETYLAVQLDLLRGVRGAPVPGVSEAAVVADGALLEDAVVRAGACVADGASVRESVLMEASRVDRGAVVVRSIVGRAARVGAEARVSELSVLGAGAEVEAGAVLSGARVEP